MEEEKKGEQEEESRGEEKRRGKETEDNYNNRKKKDFLKLTIQNQEILGTSLRYGQARHAFVPEARLCKPR